MPYTQETNIDPNDGFNPETMELALDRIVMQVQQIADDAARAVKTAPGTEGLEAVTELEEGDLLMVGANDTLVPGPNASELQTVIDLADDILDIVAGSPIVAGRYMSLAYVPSGEADVLFCDGSAVSRTTYALLFAKIGVMYGPGDSVSTFNLPDMRGRFMRGFASGQSTDPDRASRTDRGDGTTGDNVGTKQTDATAAHTHTGTTDAGGIHNHTVGSTQRFIIGEDSGYNEANVDLPTGGGPWNTSIENNRSVDSSANTNNSSSHTHTFTSGSTGGNETRPTNIAVYICITTGLAPS